jgi:5'(3')-deoxyribonucleotidase
VYTNDLPKIPLDAIGFDFDGVIADIGESFLRLACQDHGYCDIRLEDIKSFKVETYLDIPATVIDKIFTDILENSIGTGLKPMEGAVTTITRMARQSEVTIITARPDPLPVHDWLRHYYDDATCRRIKLVATGDHDNKEEFIRTHALTHFIDDRIATCLQLAEAGLNPIVYEHPWNNTGHCLPRVANWAQIESLFDL